MKLTDIYYVAGILEGEGCFNYYNAPRIFLKMTDRDVVEKIRSIMNINIYIGEKNKNGWKTAYILAVNSHHAIGWMMTLFPLMSIRRREQIREVLFKWRNAKGYNGFTITTGEKLISMIARKHSISANEARRRLYDGEFTIDSTGRTYIGGPLKTPKIVEEFRSFVNPFQKIQEGSVPCQEL